MEEKEQKETVIDFRGDHIHFMDKDHCTVCGKTHEEIIQGIKF